ncbi:trypsin-like peptidase domain-containing protein [Pedobacter jeongneungensis]|uniref:trypsin-like peptidase domain-containing protein n=1 Tax=Pedobacter jeongneungensis TaxID=947309 RepID=UPI00046AA9AB|nr:trypsin-like peptidase domain-containing protein [Pedobacter jeongneungensis]
MSLPEMESRLKLAIERGRKATVLISDYDGQNKRITGNRFSGVVVSPEGVILTVAHAAFPKRLYQVTFPDGQKCLASGLGRIAEIDAAVLKIIQSDSYPFAQMGTTLALTVNEPCLSIGYPAPLEPAISLIRFGYVAEVESKDRAGMLRTTCLMEPGDSGGPTFNLAGQVIGLRSSIRNALQSNFDVPVDLYLKYWTPLLQAVDYQRLPAINPEGNKQKVEMETSPFNFDQINKILGKSNSTWKGTTFKIYSLLKGKMTAAFTTAINLKGTGRYKGVGQGLLLGKSSLIGNDPTVDIGKEKEVPARIVARDEKADLVLMGVDYKLKNAIAIDLKKTVKKTEESLGEFLVSPYADGTFSFSVLGSEIFNMAGKLRGGYLGVFTEEQNGKLLVYAVNKSAAGDTLIKVGDELLKVGSTPVHTSEQFLTQTQNGKPGGSLGVLLRRNGVEQNIEVKLSQYPQRPLNIADDYPGGKSEQRDGFGLVFLHDGKILSTNCGGPVFNADGAFMGLNIARYSRTTNVVITPVAITQFLSSVVSRINF